MGSNGCRTAAPWALLAFAGLVAALVAALALAAAPQRALAAEGGAPASLSGAATQAGETADARKLVVVGDSYSCAMKAGIVPWPHLAAKRLGLARDQYELVRHPGYAFAKKGHRFISLIKKQPVDPQVTHVLIMGGVGNDYQTGMKASIRYYGKTIRLLREKYPNAKVMHAVTSWRLANVKYQKAIVKRIPAFRAAAKRLDVTYLRGCEDIMKKHPSWFLPDKVHPTQAGHDAIAKLVAKKVQYHM